MSKTIDDTKAKLAKLNLEKPADRATAIELVRETREKIGKRVRGDRADQKILSKMLRELEPPIDYAARKARASRGARYTITKAPAGSSEA